LWAEWVGCEEAAEVGVVLTCPQIDQAGGRVDEFAGVADRVVGDGRVDVAAGRVSAERVGSVVGELGAVLGC
jgi:hypothetical protein